MTDKPDTVLAAVPAHTAPWQPSNEQLVAASEKQWITRLLANHDTARAAAPKVTLTAITDFIRVTDEAPDGETIVMGEEFQISEFDLPRYLGKGLPRVGG